MHYEKNESPNAILSDSAQKRIKGECLLEYSTNEPKLFWQIECFGPETAYHYIIDPDGTGQGLLAGLTWELMLGAPVRILISDDYDDPKLLANLLTAAAKWIRRDYTLVKKSRDREMDRQQQLDQV